MNTVTDWVAPQTRNIVEVNCDYVYPAFPWLFEIIGIPTQLYNWSPKYRETTTIY